MTTGKDQSQPSPGDLPDRLDSVLTVVYLVFTGGYAATSGPALLQADLSGEAIYLGRMLLDAFRDAEVQGLLALMLFHESRREARVSPDGVLVLPEDQDRSLWKRELMEEGVMLVVAGFRLLHFASGDCGGSRTSAHGDGYCGQGSPTCTTYY
jgi:RNA polymerase sigma-70 factor (ECF subfamily)